MRVWNTGTGATARIVSIFNRKDETIVSITFDADPSLTINHTFEEFTRRWYRRSTSWERVLSTDYTLESPIYEGPLLGHLYIKGDEGEISIPWRGTVTRERLQRLREDAITRVAPNGSYRERYERDVSSTRGGALCSNRRSNARRDVFRGPR